MKIAMIASEATPFAKTGGLADVIGTLSAALARLGHELYIITPAYRSTLQGNFALRESAIDNSLPRVGGQEATILESSRGNAVDAYLIRADGYFDRDFLYGTPAGDYPDNAERFIFFSRAALEILRRRPVDVVHCHDWQAALAAVFLRAEPARYPEIAAASIVFTIHNIGFQGVFPSSVWPLLDLDPSYFTPPFLEYYGNVNFLKGGLIFADKITTVSPSYAQEILTAEQGFGLEGVLRERAADLVGILNGVDYHYWNPWTDPFLPCHYGENSLAVKRDCKASLQHAVGLPELSRCAANRDDFPFDPAKGLRPRRSDLRLFDGARFAICPAWQRRAALREFFPRRRGALPRPRRRGDRLQRVVGPSDRGGSGSVFDAFALRAVRSQSDVQPEIWHDSHCARHRRLERYGGGLRCRSRDRHRVCVRTL